MEIYISILIRKKQNNSISYKTFTVNIRLFRKYLDPLDLKDLKLHNLPAPFRLVRIANK